jgi:hypothetical protein
MSTHPQTDSKPSRLPWVIAACSTTVAVAALALLATWPPGTAEFPEAEEPSEQVEAPQAELEAIKRASGPEIRIVEVPVEPDAEVIEARVEEAVEQAIIDRDHRRLEAARDKAVPAGSARIAVAVDTLVADGVLDETTARAVQDLLETELDAVWVLKEDAITGALTGEQARAEYKDLRAETDAALAEHLPPEDIEALREALDDDGK